MGLQHATVASRLPAQDLERARRWYREHLGLEPHEEREGGLRYLLPEGEFSLFLSSSESDGSFTQIAFSVPDIDRTMNELRRAGVVFVEYDIPGLKTVRGVADIAGNYPSKGRGERGAWFHDSEGNLVGIGQPV